MVRNKFDGAWLMASVVGAGRVGHEVLTMVWVRIIACIVYTEFITEWGGESEFTVEVQTAQDATSTQSM